VHARQSLTRLIVILSMLTALLALITAQAPSSTLPSGSEIRISSDRLSLQATKGDDKDKDKDKSKNMPNYKKYLENPSELGFSPTVTLLKEIHDIMGKQFYGKIDEGKLVDATKDEVERLLGEAGITAPFQGETFSSPEEFLEKALNKYGGKVSRDLISYAAVCGILKGASDPYTVYMTPREYSTLMEQMQSAAFAGIGIYIELDPDNDNWLTVIETIEGTPAQKAGLKSGDIITEIDGKPTKGLSIDLAVSRLRGLQGTPVTLTIQRKGTSGAAKYAITREKIRVRSVTYKMLDNNIGYVKLRLFGEDTNAELQEALKTLKDQGMKSVILDLRNNGGGYINAAVDISSIFINRGDPVVRVIDKSGVSKSHLARGDFKLDFPLMVLVNKYSASASEITAGALKDYNRGILVGTKTFGKGSVQQVRPFPDGSALKITMSHYYTPRGKDIDKNGLEPDYKVEMEPKEVGKDKDPQLDKAIELLKSTAHSRQ
jgi:carboxyl-terminal processing protease